MTYNKAKDSIIKVIKDRVATLNLLVKCVHPEHELVERFRIEIRGMLVCLNNICSADESWRVNYLDDFTEFGYFDDNGNWISVEK